jgi:hypothetical protein
MANGEFNHRLSDFIVVVRKLIPEEDCKSIIAAYGNNPRWQWSMVGREHVEVNFEHRKVRQINLSDPGLTGSDDKFFNIDKKVFNYAGLARNTYIKTLQEKRGIESVPDASSDEGYVLLHYKEGYYFKEHADDRGGTGRSLTLTLNLNEDYEGGLFRFLRGEFDVKLGTGDAVMFPSNFLFPHEVTEISRGERYSIVTWFH